MLSHSSGRNKIINTLDVIIISSLALYSLVFVVLGFIRMKVPFQIEVCEGALLDQTYRLFAGQKMFVPPGMEYVPHNYPPFYFYLAAVVSKFTGIGFAPLRLISIFSTVGIFVVLFKLAFFETKSWKAGLIASGLFAIMFEISGRWYDTARIDSLFLFLVLLGALYLKTGTLLRHSVVAAMAFLAAFFTKQTALGMILPLLLWGGIYRRKSAMAVAALFFALSVALTVYFNIQSDGWYYKYVFELSSYAPLNFHGTGSFFRAILAGRIGILLALSMAAIVVFWVSRLRGEFVFYSFMLLSTVVVALLCKAKLGGYVNAVIPVYAVCSLAAGIYHGQTSGIRSGGQPGLNEFVPGLLLRILLLVQIVCLAYPPWKSLYTPHEFNLTKQKLEIIADTKGNVYFPFESYLGPLAGRKYYSHWSIIHEVLTGKVDNEIKRMFVADMADKLKNSYFKCIYTENSDVIDVFKTYAPHYVWSNGIFQAKGRNDCPVLKWPGQVKTTGPEYDRSLVYRPPAE